MLSRSVLDAADLLRSYALSKGWVAASGLPDETRSGRQILKDFVNGKLLHCERPPTCTLSNTQLGLTGHVAFSKPTASATHAAPSNMSSREADQAQMNSDSHTQSESGGNSAAELGESSEQDDDDTSEEEERQGSSGADISNGSEAEASTTHLPVMSDADRELMEAMSAPQGRAFVLSTYVSIDSAVSCTVPCCFARSLMFLLVMTHACSILRIML